METGLDIEESRQEVYGVFTPVIEPSVKDSGPTAADATDYWILKPGSERGLCETCATCNWKYHFFNDSRDSDFALSDKDKFERYEHRITWERLGEARLRCQCYGDNGISYFELPDFLSMVRNRCTCSLCDLIVRALASKDQGIDFFESNGIVSAEFPRFEPSSNKDQVVLNVRAISTPVDMFSKTAEVNFTLLDDGSPSDTNWNRRHGDLPARPLLNSCVKIETVIKWLKNCQDFHENSIAASKVLDGTPSITESTLCTFRVVDVETDSVKLCLVGTRYVALSYVWGGVASYHLQRKNVKDSAKTEHPFPLHRAALPRTIRDAMHLTEMIGERYLWVDALCILQDDQDEVTRTVKAMNQIYKQAILTVIAACGDDANAGLRGVFPGSRIIEPIIGCIDETPLVTAEEAVDEANTIWATRGWTFQEDILRQAPHLRA
jgi:hypothetical protein